MLSHISWAAYWVSLLIATVAYYALVLARYNTHLLKRHAIKGNSATDLFPPLADTDEAPDIIGATVSEPSQLLEETQLAFGPAEPDEQEDDLPVSNEEHPDINSDFSEMTAEIRILVRLVSDSGESRENFELLFRLIVQKYPALYGTAYQRKINELLLAENLSGFAFELTAAELNELWNPKQSDNENN